MVRFAYIVLACAALVGCAGDEVVDNTDPNAPVTINGCTLTGKVVCPGADLRTANLNYYYLEKADFAGADFTDASLVGADLTKADLTGADLTGADLSKADLTDAKLEMANLRDVIFDEATKSVRHPQYGFLADDGVALDHAEVSDMDELVEG